MTVIPWRRSRAEQEARALHPSAASTRSGRRPDAATPASLATEQEADTPPARGTDDRREESLVTVCSADRCRRYLRASSEGRLSYSTGRGPVTLVVPFITGGLGSILIPVAPFNEARQYVPGQEVTLEVTGSSPEFLQWVVRVTGRAGQQVLFRGDDGDSVLPDGPANPPPVPLLDSGELAVLVLPMNHVRGYGIPAPAPAPTAMEGRDG